MLKKTIFKKISQQVLVINKRKIFRISLVLLLILTTITISLYAYIGFHKKEVLAKIQEQFNKSYNGSLIIKDMQPNFWKQFPNVSIELQEISIRDSQWAIHRTDFLAIKKAFAKIQFAPLFVGKIKIGKLILSDGKVTIFTDENGYTNSSIFAKKEKNKQKNSSFKIKQFELENIRFKYTHQLRKKDFEFNCNQLNGLIDSKKNISHVRTRGKIKILQCQFNTDKGSFFKNQNLHLQFAFQYNKDSNILTFKEQALGIKKNKLSLTGKFIFNGKGNPFSLTINSKSLQFNDALSWVSPNMYAKLKAYNIVKPLSISLLFFGNFSNQKIPSVRISILAKNNSVETKIGTFESCGFKMEYQNGTFPFLGDDYASLNIEQLSGVFAGIKFLADTTKVHNLKSPQICTHIQTKFAIKNLNKILKTESFIFEEGEAYADIRYCGNFNKGDSVYTKINGQISIKNAGLTYKPRAIKFNRCALNLFFTDQGIYLENSILNTLKSELKVTAYSNNFINNFVHHPENIEIEARLKSNKIDLNEFQTFLQKRKTSKKKNTKQKTDYLDNAFAASNGFLSIDVKDLVYKKFEAKNIKAKISLLKDRLELTDVSLLHSKGQIKINGSIQETSTEYSTFNINAAVENVLVDSLLYSFDNFGQSTFKANNIKGIVSIQTKLNGRIDKNARLMTPSLDGYASLVLNNAKLINFEPLDRMGRMFFKRKKLANVQFEQLKNTFTIEGNKITIPPMWVKTNLIDMQVQGVYNLKIGTDLLIEIPLFQGSNNNLEENSETAHSKGFRLFVSGKDDDQGNLHFSVKMRNKEINAARKEGKKNREKRRKRQQKN